MAVSHTAFQSLNVRTLDQDTTCFRNPWGAAMTTFDLRRFREEFAAVMTRVQSRIAELDEASDDLHRRVRTFTVRMA